MPIQEHTDLPTTRSIRSWGCVESFLHRPRPFHWHGEPFPAPMGGRTTLPYGLGRSYGDSCLNEGGELILTRGMNRFLGLDPVTGVLRCEAGVTLDEILRLMVPRGWFLPVTPGTRFVTVGGGIANDVHGKNHHRAGTFGHHVRRLELLRSDGTRMICGPEIQPDWFAATVGGLGLTGLITWAELALRPIAHGFLDVEEIKMRDLSEFFSLARESDRDWEYTVAWVDCLARGRSLGRGVFIRGNHAETGSVPPEPKVRAKSFPVNAPNWLLNRGSVRLFNTAYFHKHVGKTWRGLKHYRPFFYPLDGVLKWNRMYGNRGFYQHQCVVPNLDDHGPIRRILETVAKSHQASFLAVLKVFGDRPSPGLLSFPRPGVTLALDLPNRGPRTRDLLQRLDELVLDLGGATYPAKDGQTTPKVFQQGYPRWQTFRAFVDPAVSSSYWRRVAETRP